MRGGRREFRIVIMACIWLVAMSLGGTVFGQEESGEALRLRFRRNFGYSLGAQMQGTFTIRAEGPQGLERVAFLLDGEVIGQATEAPFSLSFNTRDYPEGIHQFSAIGYQANGQELQTETISRQFVATSAVTIVVIAIVALVIAFRVGSYFLARRSSGDRARAAAYGFLGGAVCPNCGRPFGIHWWSLRLGLGRYDRCPHCGKWNMVQRATAEALASAEAGFGRPEGGEDGPEQRDEEEAYRRRIEESKYDKG